MKTYLDQFDVPAGVSVASYDDVDVREVLSRASVVVTDYSSIAFNAGDIDVPVVYFQFDADEYYSGHTERPGYFTYADDGFGPVCATVGDTARAVAATLEEGMAPTYARRVEETFPLRDGGNCGRVYRAMLETVTRRPLEERLTPAEREQG